MGIIGKERIWITTRNCRIADMTIQLAYFIAPLPLKNRLQPDFYAELGCVEGRSATVEAI